MHHSVLWVFLVRMTSKQLWKRFRILHYFRGAYLPQPSSRRHMSQDSTMNTQVTKFAHSVTIISTIAKPISVSFPTTFFLNIFRYDTHLATATRHACRKNCNGQEVPCSFVLKLVCKSPYSSVVSTWWGRFLVKARKNWDRNYINTRRTFKLGTLIRLHNLQKLFTAGRWNAASYRSKRILISII